MSPRRWLDQGRLAAGCIAPVVLLLSVLSAHAYGAGVQPCGQGSKKTGQTYRVNGSEVVLRSGPSKDSQKLINEKLSAAIHSTEYLTITNTSMVQEECTRAGWSLIRITEPDWLRDSHYGWVKSTSLRGEKKNASGQVEFTEADFYWDEDTTPYKAIIVAGVNKIHRENARCKTIDPGTASISGSKGTQADPVFFVTCGSGMDVFNVFFAKADVAKGDSMRASAHLDKSRAIDLCEKYAKFNATHPSTVEFSRFVDLAVTEHPNGRTTVNSSFKAKNSFNLELKYNIRCLLSPKGLIEANVAEAN